MLRHTIFGAPLPEPPPAIPGRVSFAQLRTAASVDPAAGGALLEDHEDDLLARKVYPHETAIRVADKVERCRSWHAPQSCRSTVVLPRRSFVRPLGRLMHDHTAGKIAAEVSQIPHPTVTIVPLDVRGRPTRTT